jgi:hypothetical protein
MTNGAWNRRILILMVIVAILGALFTYSVYAGVKSNARVNTNCKVIESIISQFHLMNVHTNRPYKLDC